MFGEVYWAAFVPSAIAMAAIPGANQLLSLRNGLRHGPAPAIGATAGRFSAFALMVIAVAAGVGTILATSQVAFSVIKWGGVAYLTWLGAHTILTAGREEPSIRPSEDGTASGRQLPRLMRQEFVVAAANPKALILFTVFLPQFVRVGNGHSLVGPLLLTGAAYIAVEFCCACGYATLGSRLGISGISRRFKRWMDRGSGLALLGLADWTATDHA